MEVFLLLQAGPPIMSPIPVTGAEFRIGRAEGCDLRPPHDDAVSRNHCVIRINSGVVTIQDLGSTNGTHVQGQKISGAVELSHRDQIQIGKRVFLIVFGQMGQTAALGQTLQMSLLTPEQIDAGQYSVEPDPENDG